MKKVFLNPGQHSVSTSLGLLVLRVAPGLMMLLSHGWGKLMTFGEKAASFPDPLGIGHQYSMAGAVGAEAVCSALVVLGLATRWVSAPLVFTMMVATFMIHADDGWGKQEFAVLYAVPFLVLMFTGAGRFSLDGIWGSK